MTWSPLTTHWQVNTVDRRSRRGRKVTGIGHHHTASTSLAGSLSQFLPGGRTVTPNYCIWRDRVIGIVDEDYRALTTADATADESSITYEIVNETGPNAWAFHEQTLQTVARLDADIVRRYGVPLQEGLPGFWQHRNIYEWFRRGYATACAGPSWSTADIIARVRAELGTKPITPTIPIEEDETTMPTMYVHPNGAAMLVWPDHWEPMTEWHARYGVNQYDVVRLKSEDEWTGVQAWTDRYRAWRAETYPGLRGQGAAPAIDLAALAPVVDRAVAAAVAKLPAARMTEADRDDIATRTADKLAARLAS